MLNMLDVQPSWQGCCIKSEPPKPKHDYRQLSCYNDVLIAASEDSNPIVTTLWCNKSLGTDKLNLFEHDL